MAFRVGLSARLSHLDPSLPVVTKAKIEPFDVTLFLAEELEPWIDKRYRMLRPMILNNESEARRALEYFISYAKDASSLPPSYREGHDSC